MWTYGLSIALQKGLKRMMWKMQLIILIFSAVQYCTVHFSAVQWSKLHGSATEVQPVYHRSRCLLCGPGSACANPWPCCRGTARLYSAAAAAWLPWPVLYSGLAALACTLLWPAVLACTVKWPAALACTVCWAGCHGLYCMLGWLPWPVLSTMVA